jgi:hypothetical protein
VILFTIFIFPANVCLGISSVLAIIIKIIILLHGEVRLTCSGIPALPSFRGASTIFSSCRFVAKGVLGGLILSIFSRWLIQFCLFGSHVIYSREP